MPTYYFILGVYDKLNAIVKLDTNRGFNRDQLLNLISERLGNANVSKIQLR